MLGEFQLVQYARAKRRHLQELNAEAENTPLGAVELSGSMRFGMVEPPRTQVKLHRMPGYQCCTMVRTGSALAPALRPAGGGRGNSWRAFSQAIVYCDSTG